jgi:hypothetical protein
MIIMMMNEMEYGANVTLLASVPQERIPSSGGSAEEGSLPVLRHLLL